jgi:predicted dehydrogenase/threonine dehydrogenase-like Zn-dependent dehydrogenase
MKQVFQTARGGLTVDDVPPPVIRPGGLLVRNMCSLVSAGTERAAVSSGQKSLVGRAVERPDLVQQVLRKIQTSGVKATYQAVIDRLDASVPLGYSSAGIVTEVGRGVTEFTVGQPVACAGGGYASHAEVIFVPVNLCVPLPIGAGEKQTSVPFEQACFTTVGAIALQGVRQAEAALGEHIAVIGLGLVGLLTVQLLKAAGCVVTGIDLNPSRVELAKSLGADHGIVGGSWGEDAGNVVQHVHGASYGRGADAVIITAATSSSDPVRLAGAIARDRAKVVIVGDVHADVPRDTFYEREIEVRFSRSYGPGRYDRRYEEKGIDYPIGYVRWTEKRNMEAILGLIAEKKIDVERLISHRFPIERAPEAYDVLIGKGGSSLAIVLTYPGVPAATAIEHETVTRRAERNTVGVAFAGAGAFARDVLLPAVSRVDGVSFQSVVTSTPGTATTVARRYKFASSGCDVDALLHDNNVDAVFITTRHDSHAQLAIDALTSGKHVFLEKPLCVDEGDLAAVEHAIAQATLRGQVFMLGFNRRFAPASIKLRDLFAKRTGPLAISYRINAGHIPAEHWTQDPEQGGGRIVGEVCHFVDLATWLTGSSVLRVAGEAVGADGAVITLKFHDGSAGVIQYLTNGSSALRKERIEVMASGAFAVLDDFVALNWGGAFGAGQEKWKRQDKGHATEVAAFIQSVRSGNPSPVPPADAIATTRTIFAVLRSIREGRMIDAEQQHATTAEQAVALENYR